MTNILLNIAFLLTASILLNEAPSVERTAEDLELLSDNFENLIDDGWHTAKVTYSNPKKITKTNSKLKVQVQDDKVIKIELGNGKILHEREPQSDYLYSGGLLNFEFDLRIKEKIARTSVKIQSEHGNLSFYEIAIL